MAGGYSVIHNGVAQRRSGGAVRRSRKAPDTNVGVAKHAAGIIGACQGQTPISRPLDLSGLSTVTADASLVASRYTRMKNAVT